MRGLPTLIAVVTIHSLLVIGSVSLLHAPGDLIRIWPATAFLIFSLWRLRPAPLWPAIVLLVVAGIGARLLVGGSLLFSATSVVINFVEVGLGLALLSGLGEARLDRNVPTFLKALGLVGGVVTLVGMPFHAAILALSFDRPWSAVAMSVALGGVIGAALILPLVAAASTAAFRAQLRGRAAVENAALLVMCGTVLWFTVFELHQPTLILMLPVLVAAVRRGRLPAAVFGVLQIGSVLLAGRFGLLAVGWPFAASGLVAAPWIAVAILLPYCIAMLVEELAAEREKISTSETYFRDAMNHSPFGMALLDLDGRCFSVNRALCEFLGYAPDEIIGRASSDFALPEEREKVAPRLHGLVTGRYDDYTIEKRFLHKDGTPLWAFVAVSAVRDEATGRALYMIVQMQDISARRETEKALEESESRWNFALESAGQGVWDHDYGRNRTFYSATWARMLGYRPEDMSSESDAWLSLVHPFDLPRLLHQEHLHLEGRTAQFECEFRMRHKDGHWVWILDRGKVIAHGPDGRPTRMIGTHTDITEHRLLTEALQQEKERLRITLQSIGDGVICTDEEGRVTFVNPIAEALTGWSATAALGRPCDLVFRVVHEIDDVPVENVVTTCLARLDRVARDEGMVLVGRSGARVDVKASASPVRKPTGEVLGAVLVFQDVTRARTLQKELAVMASHDALTGLLNRTSFERRLEEHCAELASGGREHTLVFLDLDRFKIINDTAGHAAGDVLLREIGRLIREHMRRADVVARLGGDEFGVLIVDTPIGEAEAIAERLLERIGRTRFAWSGRVYEVGASVGLARVDGETPHAADVMSRADVACYAAKASGRNRVSVYHPSEGDARRHHHELYTAAGIRAALETGRFVVYAQTIADLRPSGRLHHHAELLVRMIEEDGSILSPGAFIPAAERYGLMAAIDRFMISQVLERYDRAILAVPRLVVSINLSANSLEDPGLLAYLAEKLEGSALPPHRIHFEITETSLINNLTHAGRLVEALRAAGYSIMLDDFGAGVSSFAYLEQFPVDYLKIDGSFVRKLTTSFVDRAIVESINDIGHKLGAITVAEFVEDAETLQALEDIGIDMAQGYHIARPQPLEELLERLSDGSIPALPERMAG
ncbi:EAL domain-containing protein [Siculibacillus lacustris]|uniref:EAL domain-containing protein n=1 Tax=Siculibacillus lacustris TaxID=1549641 RepID=UPI0013F156EE|nr:EAL domain-containing protein [Siculibacillus lacustris]